MQSYGMFIRQNLDQINHTYFDKELIKKYNRLGARDA